MNESNENEDLSTQLEETKVTANPPKKVKNPNRVAAGKRLAAKNKERLEKLKAAKLIEDVPTPQLQQNTTPSNVPTTQQFFWIAGGLLITLGIGYLYTRPRSPPLPPPPPNHQIPKPPDSVFI